MGSQETGILLPPHQYQCRYVRRLPDDGPGDTKNVGLSLLREEYEQCDNEISDLAEMWGEECTTTP